MRRIVALDGAGARLGALFAALAGCALLVAPAAEADGYFGSSYPIKQMRISFNPKTRNAQIEARYIRTTCTDGREPGGVNPGPMKVHVSRNGKFQASLSQETSFLYIQGRITKRRASGRAFYWRDWFDPHTCTTGPIRWSIPRVGLD